MSQFFNALQSHWSSRHGDSSGKKYQNESTLWVSTRKEKKPTSKLNPIWQTPDGPSAFCFEVKQTSWYFAVCLEIQNLPKRFFIRWKLPLLSLNGSAAAADQRSQYPDMQLLIPSQLVVAVAWDKLCTLRLVHVLLLNRFWAGLELRVRVFCLRVSVLSVHAAAKGQWPSMGKHFTLNAFLLCEPTDAGFKWCYVMARRFTIQWCETFNASKQGAAWFRVFNRWHMLLCAWNDWMDPETLLWVRGLMGF